MRNFTIANLKKNKGLTLVASLLFFTLGAMAQTGTPAKSSELQVLAHYYPDVNYANGSSARVFWGMDLDQDTIDFENGAFPTTWLNEGDYPWVVTTPRLDTTAWNGTHCMKSGNAGQGNSTSSIQASVYFQQSGTISFIAGCYGEEGYDFCEFYIDGKKKFIKDTTQPSWNYYSYDVSQGFHTFKWSYTKDVSLDSEYDGFYVDDIIFTNIGGAKANNNVYNVYRSLYDAATGGSIGAVDTIAEYVTDNQWIDTTWGDLPVNNEYQYGVEILFSTAQIIYWSNILPKPEPVNYTITVTADPADGGTVSGGGSFAYGDTCTLTATPNDGFEFYRWLVDGLPVGYDEEYSFIVTEDANIVARFERPSLSSEFYVRPEGSGEIEMIGADEEDDWVVRYLDTITLRAIPNMGFSFVKWEIYGSELVKGGNTKDAELSFYNDTITVILNDDFLNSIFGEYVFDGDTIEGMGPGSVIIFAAVFEEGIDGCMRPKKFTNTEVGPDFATLSWDEKGEAESWYIFYHDTTPTPTVPEDSYVQVNENPCTIWELLPETTYEAYVVSSCGVEDGVPNRYLTSDTIRFTTLGPCPTPLHVEVDSVAGCTAVVKWMDYSDSYLVEAGLLDLMVNENFNSGIPSDWDNTTNYPWRVVDTLTNANGGFCMMSGNQGVGSSSSSISVTVTYSSDGIVEFDAECRGEGGGESVCDKCIFSIDGENKFSYGGNVEGWKHYSYNVPEGEHIFTWSYTKDGSVDPEGDYFAVDNVLMRGEDIEWNNSLSVEEAQCTITGLTPLTPYAVHVQGICDNEETEWSNLIYFTTNDVLFITASVNPTGAGTVTGAGEYHLGDTCTLVATANTGYIFANWTKGGRIYSDEETISFAVSQDAEFVANFERIEYYLSLSPAPQDGGSTEFLNDSIQVFHYGDEVSIKATPNQGYNFVNWTVWEGNDEIVLTANPNYNFTIGGNNPVTTLYPEGGQIALIANFEMRNLDITVTTNPVAGGTVQVSDTIFTGGTFAYGETLTMNAIDNEGYTFRDWTKNDTVVSNSRTLNITVTESASYVANFTLNSYAIDATVNPAVGGTVTGTGTYNHGQSCTLTATANTGYHFLNWTLNNQEVSDSENITIEVTEAANYVANFEINSYDITAMVSVNPTDGGTVNGAGTYNYGQTCDLTAIPAIGHHFVNWTKNGTQVSTDPHYSFVVTGEDTYVANFELNSYDVTAMVSVNPTNGGTVTGTGTYNYGQTCNLTAVPATGHHFVNWTKNGTQVSTDPNYSFVVTGEDTYVANFEINSYDVTAMVSVNPTNGGTVNGMGTFTYGQTCDLTAVPAEGFHFVKWTKNGTQVSTNPVYSFTVTEEANYVAYFEINSYAITATANPTDGGTITGAGTYNHFENCTLTATPATGYTFLRWTKNGTQVSTNPTYTFQVTEAASYVAQFQLNSYEITATANPTDGGTIAGAGTYNHFANCTLTATPATGYHFVKWTKNGTQVSTNTSYTFEVTGAASYVAHFELNSYAITATANPTAGGTVTGAGTYNHFENCTLTATPATGYTFLRWTKNGTQVSTNPTYTFQVTEAASYVAQFQLNSYEITATANPTDGGTIAGAGTYNHFENCTLTATPATGYTFLRWTKNGTQVSTNPTYTFQVTEAASYVAQFQLNSYEITATANPSDGGTITGANTYNHFESCTLTATPATGYHFVNWTEGNNVISTEATYSFIVTGARTLVANFEINSYTITAMANPISAGTVSGAGDFNHFETCTLTATPAAGYYFVRWTKGSEIISTEAVYSFEVTESATYKAHFAKYTYAITAEANPEEGGTISGTGESFYYNTTCQLIANHSTGYHFVNWTLDGVEVSTNRIYNFTVTESAHYIANFELDTFEITASVDPEEAGTITGAGTYNYGETVTLTAEANTDFRFENWTENGEVISEEATLTFTVEGDRQLVAHFINTVGITENDALTVSIYPNPVSDKLTIETSEPVKMVEIYSINGALLAKQVNCSEKIEINVANYAFGTYMIRLTTDNGVEIRKFVKE